MRKNIYRIGCIILAVTLLSACSTTKLPGDNEDKSEDTTMIVYPNAYKDINPDEVLDARSIADIAYNPSDVNVMASKSTDIALVTVTSIDGGSNVNELTGEYIYPYTYGKLQVLEVFKGDLSEGQEIEYVRMGGIISYNSYLSSLYPAQREKIVAQSGVKPAYIKMMFEDDVEIESGKTYLVYMLNSSSGNVSKENAFAIIGWEGGLREARGVEQLQTRSTAELQIEVFNNYTQSWEFLNQVITE